MHGKREMGNGIINQQLNKRWMKKWKVFHLINDTWERLVMLSKRYSTQALSTFFTRFTIVYSVCHDLDLFQGSTDVGLYVFEAVIEERVFKVVTELSGVQFGLRSYAWFQNLTSAQRESDLKSEVQLPLY